MKLNDELYEIKHLCENEAEIMLNSGSLIYKAHFPGEPITPGVCIIQIATELFSMQIGKSLFLKEVSNAKFLAVIDPRVTNILKYEFSKISYADNVESVKVTVQVKDSATVYAKLSLLYGIG